MGAALSGDDSIEEILEPGLPSSAKQGPAWLMRVSAIEGKN
jgi:hypothetical protein